MEQESSQACGEKGYCRIESDEEWNQDRGAECHEHELKAYYRTLQWG